MREARHKSAVTATRGCDFHTPWLHQKVGFSYTRAHKRNDIEIVEIRRPRAAVCYLPRSAPSNLALGDALGSTSLLARQVVRAVASPYRNQLQNVHCGAPPRREHWQARDVRVYSSLVGSDRLLESFCAVHRFLYLARAWPRDWREILSTVFSSVSVTPVFATFRSPTPCR